MDVLDGLASGRSRGRISGHAIGRERVDALVGTKKWVYYWAYLVGARTGAHPWAHKSFVNTTFGFLRKMGCPEKV